jgi:hypothetical protein
MRAVAIALALAGCGGFSPEGEHRRYVIAELDLPTGPTETTRLSRDVNGDNRAENRFAQVFTALAENGANLEDHYAHSIPRGGYLELVDLQARDLATASAASVQLYKGKEPTPTPCSSSMICGQHLKGTGHFEVESPYLSETAELPGTIRGGVFVSLPGDLLFDPWEHSFGTAVTAIGARIELTYLADDKIEGVISGAIERATAISLGQQWLEDMGRSDLACDIRGTPPDCGCSTPFSLSLMRTYDTDRNCLLLDDELDPLEALLAPLDTSDVSLGGRAALSFGIGFRAVAATFEP